MTKKIQLLTKYVKLLIPIEKRSAAVKTAKIIFGLSIYFSENCSFASEVISCIAFDNFRQYQSTALWMTNSAINDKLSHTKILSKLTDNNNLKSINEQPTFLVPEVIKGKGNLLVYEHSFKGWPQVRNSHYVESLIIELPEVISSNERLIFSQDSKNIAIIRTGTPLSSSYCIGYAVSGSIEYASYRKSNPAEDVTQDIFFSEILHTGDSILATLSLEFKQVDEMGKTNENCSASCYINAEILFKHGNFEDLQKLHWQLTGIMRSMRKPDVGEKPHARQLKR